MRNRLAVVFLAGTSLCLSSCGDSDAAASEQTDTAQTTPTPTTPTIPTGVRPAPVQEEIGQIPDLTVTTGFFLGGQPESMDFEDLKREGARAVLDLRMPDEVREFDEASAVIDAELEYFPLGFTPRTLTDDILDQAREIMRDENRQPMLVHCASANRVGAVWLAFRILDEGLSEEAALAEAETVGLRSPVMREKVLEYARKNKK